jgi:hypothetical protein
VFFFTDSTTVLHFIKNETKRFPIFVANRVQSIRRTSSPDQWFYVQTSDNPADEASRGLTAITSESRWLTGPSFIRSTQMVLPTQPQEVNVMVALTIAGSEDTNDVWERVINHYSNWGKLKRCILIYLRCLRVDVVARLNEAEASILRYIQRKHFGAELKALKGGVSVSRSSSIRKLDPYLDPDTGLLRVRGRLRNALIPEEERYPIILPKKEHVTTLIIRDYHERLAHAGRNHVVAMIRERFWLISASTCVRGYIRTCVTCKKLRQPCCIQKMADLPKSRLTPAPAFSYVGVDFFGPFIVKDFRKAMKRYGVIFTCLVTRAVHLEVAASLETDSFINALQRFICRRGLIKELRCDNGTNFHGAERELRQAIALLNTDTLNEKMLHYEIKWIFNPPGASHMGGAWERLIRSVRNILSGLMIKHGHQLNNETLQTLLCEVEFIMNSRPISATSDDPNDMTPITPSLLLTMKPRSLPPPGPFTSDDVFSRKRWRRVQALSDQFWYRWRREYLSFLQPRPKWNNKHRILRINDVVLIRDENLERHHWKMGRVVKCLADCNGLVRSVFLKTATSELHRPVHKLVLLLPADVPIP